MVRSITCNVFHMRQFCRFFYSLAWFDTVEFNLLPCSNDKKYDDVHFVDRFRYQLAKFGNRLLIGLYRFLHAHITYEIDTAKIHPHILPTFLLFAWFDTVEFNHLPCSNDKMYDDGVFADRFQYKLTMFGYRLLIGLSRLLHAYISYEADTAKNHRSILPNFSVFAWIDTVEFNRLSCSNNKVCDDAIFTDRFRYQVTMFEVVYW